MQKRKTVVPPARERGRHLHSEHRKGMDAMTYETIRQTDLTANERQVLANDRTRWQKMGAGAHLNDWLAYGDGTSRSAVAWQ